MVAHPILREKEDLAFFMPANRVRIICSEVAIRQRNLLIIQLGIDSMNPAHAGKTFRLQDMQHREAH